MLSKRYMTFLKYHNYIVFLTQPQREVPSHHATTRINAIVRNPNPSWNDRRQRLSEKTTSFDVKSAWTARISFPSNRSTKRPRKIPETQSVVETCSNNVVNMVGWVDAFQTNGVLVNLGARALVTTGDYRSSNLTSMGHADWCQVVGRGLRMSFPVWNKE